MTDAAIRDMPVKAAVRDDDIIVSVRGLVNRFGSKTVHEGLDLEMRRGEVLGVIGGSGTGKSVLLKCILGLVRPDGGTITLEPAEGGGMVAKLVLPME